MSTTNPISNNLPTIITDSFLRSYSLSRIIRINEENKKKANVAIIRKINQIKSHQKKQQNHLKKQQHHLKFNHLLQTKSTVKCNNIQMLKQELSIIEDRQVFEEGVQKSADNRSSKKQNRVNVKLSKTLNSFITKDSLKQQNSFNTNDSVRQQKQIQSDIKHNQTKQSFFKNQQQQYNFQNQIFHHYPAPHYHADTEIKTKTLQFDKPHNNNKTNQNNMMLPFDEQQLDNPQSPLSAALNSFNRLKLMMNKKSSQNIMKHFYKRSLQNCTVDDIKYLVKMQGGKAKINNKEKQNSTYLPMKFAKTTKIRNTFGYPQGDDGFEAIDCNNKQRTVWKNQILKKNCPIQQQQTVTKETKHTQRNTPAHSLVQRDKKRNTYDLRSNKYKKYYQQKENLNSNIQNKNRQLQNNKPPQPNNVPEIQKNLIFCYKDRRFPMSENKLSGIYKKWQKQYLKKKGTKQGQEDGHYFSQQLRTKNIKLRSNEVSTHQQQQQNNNLTPQNQLVDG